MKRLSFYISLVISLIISTTPNYIHAEDKLLKIPGERKNGYEWGDFVYLGAFRVPKTDMGGPLYQGLSYGGHVIAFNPSDDPTKNGSLFIVGHDQSQLTAEIDIPTIVQYNPTKTYNIEDLTTASVRQNLTDITNGDMRKITLDGTDIGTTKMGGLMKWENSLIGSVYCYYDGDYKAVRSHFSTSVKLSSSSPQFSGMLELGTKPSPVPQAGFIGGYMTRIPDNWQDRLGGKALSGMSGLSIITRSSLGPAAFSFYPEELLVQGRKSPANATALLYYDQAHPTLGTWGSSGTLFHMGTFQAGVIFPTGTRSIIFTGQQGLGESCYGQGTKILEESSQPAYCYDPADQSKGTHSYPYAMYAWAYDANDLARVKAGKRIIDDPSDNLADGITKNSTENYKPWHIKPYAHGEIKLPFVDNKSGLKGASAYDEKNKRLYLVQLKADNSWPIIHVFQIKIDSIPDTTPKIKQINLAQ